MANDFFDDEKEEKVEEEKVDEKVKIGEKEYSQDELSKLVGLGETAQEFETRWNRPISKLYPSYTEATQKLSEYEKQQQDKEKQQIEQKVESGQQLSDEEIKRRAQEEARNLGLLTQQDVMTYVNNALDARDKLDDTEAVVAQAKEDYGIDTSVDELIAHMGRPDVPKNPYKAFKDLYENDIDKIKQERLASIKPQGMVTDAASNAGSKSPSIPRPNKENVNDLLDDVLFRE